MSGAHSVRCLPGAPWAKIEALWRKNDETSTNETQMKEHLELGLLEFGSCDILVFWDPCRYSFSLATWMTQTCKLCETSSEGLLCNEILVSSNTKTIPSKGQRDVSFVQIYQGMARVPKRTDAMQGVDGWIAKKRARNKKLKPTYFTQVKATSNETVNQIIRRKFPQPVAAARKSVVQRCWSPAALPPSSSSDLSAAVACRPWANSKLWKKRRSRGAEELSLSKMLFLEALRVHLKQLSCRKTLFIRLLFNHVFLLQSLTLFFPISLHRHCFPSSKHLQPKLHFDWNRHCIISARTLHQTDSRGKIQISVEWQTKRKSGTKPRFVDRSLHSCIKSNKCLHQV